MRDEVPDSTTVLKDAFRVLCSDLIGDGMSRQVYSSRLLKGFVVKVETAAGMFQNVMEWETWERVRGTSAERWFAPCEQISPCGTVLVMARTTPATSYPERLPVFLTDHKRSNYGMLGRRLVCHDYGLHLLMERGMSERMRRVEWWDG